MKNSFIRFVVRITAVWLVMSSLYAQMGMPVIPAEPPPNMIWHAGDGYRGFTPLLEAQVSEQLKTFQRETGYPIFLVTCNSPEPEMLLKLVNSVRMQWLSKRDGMILYFDFDTKRAGNTFQASYLDENGMVAMSQLGLFHRESLKQILEAWLVEKSYEKEEATLQLQNLLRDFLPNVKARLVAKSVESSAIVSSRKKWFLCIVIALSLISFFYWLVMRMDRFHQFQAEQPIFLFTEFTRQGQLGAFSGIKCKSRSFGNNQSTCIQIISEESAPQELFQRTPVTFHVAHDWEGSATTDEHGTISLQKQAVKRARLREILPRIHKRARILVFGGFFIFSAIVALGLYQRYFGSGFSSYHPCRDNRFVFWPIHTSIHEVKGMTMAEQSGLGWDTSGRAYALVDKKHVLGTHNDMPESLMFTDVNGNLHQRKIVARKILCTERISHDNEETQPLISLGVLAEAVPDEVLPYSLYPVRRGNHFDDVLLFAAKGRVGIQSRVFADSKHLTTGDIPWLIENVTHVGQGQMQLDFGDSGSPLMVKYSGKWQILGISHSVSHSVDSQGSEIISNNFIPIGPFYSLLTDAGVEPIPPPQLLSSRQIQPNAP